jgi:RNA polymerase sigma factor for flagellar operon FliA
MLREALIIFYMEGYVRRVASRLASLLPRCIDPEDLVQSAYFGLSECLDKYDPCLNSRFEGYAHRRIEGAMRDFLRKEDPASRLARSRSKSIARGNERFKAEFGRPPTEEELRALLQLDQNEYIAVMRDVHVPCTVSFQPNENDPDDDPMASLHIELKNVETSQVDREDLHRWLYQQLDRYDRLIVTLYYCECLSLMEIGSALGYSESRISQRLKQIHTLLKGRISDYPEIITLMAS